MMNISIVGAGYVGLVSGAGLAEVGHDVVCVDRRPEVVEAVTRGVPPFHEPGLPSLLARHAGRGLRATTDLRAAVQTTELTLIAVGTPYAGDAIDLSQVRAAAQDVGRALREKSGWHVVAVKSTVVPGTTDDVVGPLLEEHSGRRIGDGVGVGANPEFLREGEAVNDFLDPDRIVIGSSDGRTLASLKTVYAPFGGAQLIQTNNRTAETIKYATNALLATMISFSNELSRLTDAIPDVDVEDVLGGVHMDRRLMPVLPGHGRIRPAILAYLRAGCGFGGSCFPKDVRALISHARHLGIDMPLLSATMAVNAEQPARVMQRLARQFPTLSDRRVTVLGLAFKPQSDDTRESPAISLAQQLIDAGSLVCVYDPVVSRAAANRLLPQATTATSLADAVRDAEAIIIVTPWEEFRQLPALLRQSRPMPLVIDARRAFRPDQFARYDGVGYPSRRLSTAM